MTAKKLRHAMRSYARIYHTGLADIKEMTLKQFLIEFNESVEDLKKEQENIKKSQKKCRRR